MAKEKTKNIKSSCFEITTCHALRLEFNTFNNDVFSVICNKCLNLVCMVCIK